jgi:transposase-like protein
MNTIRCPQCLHEILVDVDYSALYTEGLHRVSCPECDEKFTVETTVSVTFVSSPVVGRNE